MDVRILVKYGLQPFLIIGSMVVWFLFSKVEIVQLFILIAVQVILYQTEKYMPACPDWRQTKGERVTILGITVFDAFFFGLVLTIYSSTMGNFFGRLQSSAGIDFWPVGWPILAQVILMYFAAEFVFYWIHRGIHEIGIFWRLSAHGFHHSFKNLHAINFQTAHPLECFVVLFPTAFVSLLCGVPPEVIVGSGVLGIVNSSIAHANIDTNNKIIGLVLTTAAQHRRHHSLDIHQSKSNYSCKAIIFDRIFGTYSGDGEVLETGITKRELSLMEKILIPIKPPVD